MRMVPSCLLLSSLKQNLYMASIYHIAGTFVQVQFLAVPPIRHSLIQSLMCLGVVDLDLVHLAINLVGQHGESDIQFQGLVVVVGVGDHASAD